MEALEETPAGRHDSHPTEPAPPPAGCTSTTADPRMVAGEHPLERMLTDQRRILRAFERAREAGIATPRGVRQLRAIRKRLTAYLVISDRVVLPQARALAQADDDVRRVCTQLGDHTRLARQVTRFLDRLERRPGKPFLEEWGRLYLSLQKRFRQERLVLFPALRRSTLSDELVLTPPPPALDHRPRSGIVRKAARTAPDEGHRDTEPAPPPEALLDQVRSDAHETLLPVPMPPASSQPPPTAEPSPEGVLGELQPGDRVVLRRVIARARASDGNS